MPPVLAARLDELPEGRGVEVDLGGRRVALFRTGDRVHAIDAECPHLNGPLAEGWIVGDCVECPWHGWRFDLASGASRRSPLVRVAVHATSVVEGEVWVDVGDGPGPPPGP